jgi:membrane protease YdiL (CAAX protease family)
LKEARLTKPSKQVTTPYLTAGKESLTLLLQVFLGAGLWLVLLLSWAPFHWQNLLAGQPIPAFWQNLYLLGLYLWLGICLQLSLRRSGQKWPAWGLGKGWYTQVAPAFGFGLLVFGCLWLWGYGSGQLLSAKGPDLRLMGLFSLSSLASAWALAGIEEILFRGWLWQVWLPALGPRQTLLLQALIFSAVHGESWHSGWVALHLFLIGLVLGGMRHVTGHLGASMGLHAGWIWAVLCLSQWGLLASPHGTYNPLREGPTLLIWLGPLVWITFQWLRSESESAKNAAGSASVA